MNINYAELFVWMLLGHLVGDYWLQWPWMANNKTKQNWLGWKACGSHVTLYTIATFAFIWVGAFFQERTLGLWESIGWLLGIGVPHYLIDHYCLLGKFMQWKNGGKHPFDAIAEHEFIGHTDKSGLPRKPLFEKFIPISSYDLNDVTNVAYTEHEVTISPEFRLHVWDAAFIAPVYIVTDNLAHLLMMWAMIRFLL